MPRHHSSRWLTRKHGSSRQKGKRFPISQRRRNIRVASVLDSQRTLAEYPKTRKYSEKELEDKVWNLVRQYSGKANLKTSVLVAYDKHGKRLADVRYANGGVSYIHINKQRLKELYEVDPELADKFLEYAIAHEIAHVKQKEERGMDTMRYGPKIMKEIDADKRANEYLGKTRQQTEAEYLEIEKKYRAKYGPPPEPPVDPNAPRKRMEGKKIARIIAYENMQGKVVVSDRSLVREGKPEFLPQKVKSVGIIEFDQQGRPIPQSHRYVSREQLAEYYLVP